MLDAKVMMGVLNYRGLHWINLFVCWLLACFSLLSSLCMGKIDVQKYGSLSIPNRVKRVHLHNVTVVLVTSLVDTIYNSLDRITRMTHLIKNKAHTNTYRKALLLIWFIVPINCVCARGEAHWSSVYCEMRASNLAFEFNETFKIHRHNRRKVIKIHKRSITINDSNSTNSDIKWTFKCSHNIFHENRFHNYVYNIYVQIMRTCASCREREKNHTLRFTIVCVTL